MAERSQWMTCRTVVAGPAALAGLVLFKISLDSVGAGFAGLAGVIFAALVWLALSRSFCAGAPVGIARADVQTPAGSAGAEAPARPAPVAELRTVASSAPASEAGSAAAEAASPPEGDEDDEDDTVSGGDTMPGALPAARGGKADDLRQIKGIGPQLEVLCHDLGIFHFDQIAAWTAEDLAWVDANIRGFRGRAGRDDWIGQARVLAAGGTTEFSQRVEDGKVY